MAVYNISEEDQQRIMDKIQEFMENEGIKGELQLTFTKDFEPTIAPNAAQNGCWKTAPNGILYFKVPCS